MKQDYTPLRIKTLTQTLLLFAFCFSIFSSHAQNETTLTLLDSYDIDDVGEPSGLAYDAINNQLFAVSDSDDIFRLSLTGSVLDTYDFSADLEGVTVFDTNTLLIAIEDTYELVEYNYITGNSTSHTMEYENQDDPGSGIEGVTFNPTNGEIYFLNEKDPAALIIANSNFNVTDEFELSFSGDLSASSYVDQTGFLWLGSDEESTIYKCDTRGNVLQTFPLEDDGDELDKIEGLAIDHENQLLYLVTDGDARLYVYSIDDNEEETEADNLTVSSLSDFDTDGGLQTITVNANINWSVTENSSWITIGTSNGSNNGSVNVTAAENTSTSSRTATITISGNDITRRLTVTQEAGEATTTENEDNLALNGVASQSTTSFNGAASRAIDGNINGTYRNASVTHTASITGSWWQVTLLGQTSIGDVVIYNRTDNCCRSRLSNFTVSIADNNNNTVYSQTFTEAPSPSLTIDAGDVLGRTIRVTNNLENTPLSLAEVEVYEGEEIEEDNTNDSSCTAGTNLALNGTVVDFSAEQNSTNNVNNIIDDNEDNRWSALGFPQFVVVDLGEAYNVNEINLVTFQDRDYQFTIEGSTSSASSGFSTLVNATNNTDDGPINRRFSAQTVRYVRLTVSGADSYDGPWVSIHEFEILCAGRTSNKNAFSTVDSEAFNVTAYPNPFTSVINVKTNDGSQVFGNIQLVDLSGRIITSQPSINDIETSLDNLDVTSGVYLLQIFNVENELVKVMKLIKE